MTRILTNKAIYDGTKAIIISTSGAEQIKLQAIGSGSYEIQGRIDPSCEFRTISAIKASDLSKGDTISDTEIWMADVSGICQVTVDATGFDKIMAVTLG